MKDDREELEQALTELERDVKRKKPPTRFHARAVLVPLGRLLLGGGEAGAAVGRLARSLAGDELRAAWRKACREELTLACTEHIQGVDPRYLDHPRYDFEYAVAARERLEARLRAAEELDLEPPEDLLGRVAQADAILEPYLRSRQGDESLN